MFRKGRLIETFVITALLSTFSSFANAQTYIPPYDPVYVDVIYLQNFGWLASLNLSQQPLSLNQLRTALYADIQSGTVAKANAPQKQIFSRLIQTYFKNDTSLCQALQLSPALPKPIKSPLADISLGMRLDMYYHSSTMFNIPQAPGQYLAGGLYPQMRTWGALRLTPELTLVNVMAVDPYATKNERYLGKEWRGLSGYTEQAYFLFQKALDKSSNRSINLTGGRSYIIFGPGRTGQLLMSSAARPIDNFKFDIYLPHLTFTSAVGKLDAMADNARYLTIHRLSYQSQHFDCSLSEALLYGGKGRSVEWAYLNHLLLYHGENVNGPALDGNTLGTLDWRLKGKRWQWYGELLIDDLQFDKKEVGDLEPNEIGVLLGLHLVDPLHISGLYLGSELVALTNRTYKTVEDYEWFIHRNVPLGYAAGSDLARWNLQVTKYWRSWRLTGQCDFWWRGEGEMDKLWDSPWDTCTVEQGYHEKFPTGRVEKIHQFYLQTEWFPSYDFSLLLGIGWQQITNKGHGKGNEQALIFRAGLHWNIIWNR